MVDYTLPASSAEPSEFARALAEFLPAAAEYERACRVEDDLGKVREQLQHRVAEAETAFKNARTAVMEAFRPTIGQRLYDMVGSSGPGGLPSQAEWDAAKARAPSDIERLYAEDMARAEAEPAVIAARNELEAAEEALRQQDTATGFDAAMDAVEAAGDRYLEALDKVEAALPGDHSEMMRKYEVLAIHRPDTSIDFPSVLDLVARDLWHLGARHQLSEKSARLHRTYRPFHDSPEFDADRSEATWRYVEGRGMVAEV